MACSFSRTSLRPGHGGLVVLIMRATVEGINERTRQRSLDGFQGFVYKKSWFVNTSMRGVLKIVPSTKIREGRDQHQQTNVASNWVHTNMVQHDHMHQQPTNIGDCSFAHPAEKKTYESGGEGHSLFVGDKKRICLNNIHDITIAIQVEHELVHHG